MLSQEKGGSYNSHSIFGFMIRAAILQTFSLLLSLNRVYNLIEAYGPTCMLLVMNSLRYLQILGLIFMVFR